MDDAEKAVRGLWLVRQEGLTLDGRIDASYSLVALRDGKVSGADYGVFFTGSYRFSGNEMNVKIQTTRYGVIEGLSLWGDSRGGQSLELHGVWHPAVMKLRGHENDNSAASETEVTLNLLTRW